MLLYKYKHFDMLSSVAYPDVCTLVDTMKYSYIFNIHIYVA